MKQLCAHVRAGLFSVISCSENPKHLCWVLCPGVGTGISVGWAWFQLVLPGTCCRAELLVPLGQHVWERKWGWGKRSENQPQLWGQRSRKYTRVAGIRAQSGKDGTKAGLFWGLQPTGIGNGGVKLGLGRVETKWFRFLWFSPPNSIVIDSKLN